MDPVLKAIKEDDDEALKAMMQAGRNLAEANKEGWLPLHEAAYYGQLSCLKTLHRGAAPVGAAGPGGGLRARPPPPTASCSLPRSLGDRRPS